MLRYIITIFLSAFLLFQVQPLIAKFILPWFGGSPAVWTTCMLFFQAMLLAGYCYAHISCTGLNPRRQMQVHLVLLAASLVFLPIIPSDVWKPSGDESPSLRILALLAVTIGLPYFAVSTTGPLLQSWFSRTHPGRSPYRLFALSNAGSLLALLSYPLLVEPNFVLDGQAWGWTMGYLVFVACCGWCAWQARNAATEDAPSAGEGSTVGGEKPKGPGLFDMGMWLGLSLTPSILLLAITNQMSQEVAVVPFLWVLPLSLYLLSFILCFDSDRWYRRGVWGGAAVLVIGFGAALFAHETLANWCRLLIEDPRVPAWVDRMLLAATGWLNELDSLSIPWQVAVLSSALFVSCMICHGELAKSRPPAERLTLFYLIIATGGALGGLFCVVVAPRFFDFYAEVYIGGYLFLLLVLLAWGRAFWSHRPAGKRLVLASAGMGLIATLAGGSGYVLWLQQNDQTEFLERTRNFYGVLTVYAEEDDGWGESLSLTHGTIQHGFQYVDPEMSLWKTSYYGEDSGIGLAIRFHPARGIVLEEELTAIPWLRRYLNAPGTPGGLKFLSGVLWPDASESSPTIGGRADGEPFRYGVIGLGTGTLAAYGREGNEVVFYDINPEVIRLAKTRFTYLSDCRAEVETVLGDARVQLERELDAEGARGFDVLAVDAFTSDAIPMHLLTRECFDLYWRHLKDNGVLAVHISNRYLDLRPVVCGIADEAGYEAVVIDWDNEDYDPALSSNRWVLVTRNRELLNHPLIREAEENSEAFEGTPIIWTDDYGSLLQVLK